MSGELDYSFLDRPEILSFVFYPRAAWSPCPQGVKDYLIPVEEGISISCRFYPASQASSPCILFFHGNGEIASDYDWIASLYQQRGLGLFVADYRGYGRSGGYPTFSTMIRDSHPIFRFLIDNVMQGDVPLFVMGRSLGAHSAVELASHYPQRFKGLIVESGAANPVRLLRLLGCMVAPEVVERLEQAVAARANAITLPLLAIHGEYDSLIPRSEAEGFFNAAASDDKRLVIIPGADHNDILLVGIEEYFSALAEFVLARR